MQQLQVMPCIVQNTFLVYSSSTGFHICIQHEPSGKEVNVLGVSAP